MELLYDTLNYVAPKIEYKTYFIFILPKTFPYQISLIFSYYFESFSTSKSTFLVFLAVFSIFAILICIRIFHSSKSKQVYHVDFWKCVKNNCDEYFRWTSEVDAANVNKVFESCIRYYCFSGCYLLLLPDSMLAN